VTAIRRLQHPQVWGILLAILFLAIACAPKTPKKTAEEIILLSSERMKTTSGFKFLFDRSGAQAYLDTNQTISLSKMEGSYVAPDRVKASVRVITPGLVAEINIVSIGTTQWETNIVTGEWSELPPEYGFNPARLLDPEIGLPAIIATDLTNLVLEDMQEIEEMPGIDLYVISGDMSGDKISELSYDLMDSDPMKIKLWIDPSTFELYRALITEHSDDLERKRIWQIDFWDFEVLEEITAPIQ